MPDLKGPGAYIQTFVLDAFGLTQGELAGRLGVSRRTINELIGARRRLSADMVLRLSRLTGQSPEFWLNLQMQYDLQQIKQAEIPTQIIPLTPR